MGLNWVDPALPLDLNTDPLPLQNEPLSSLQNDLTHLERFISPKEEAVVLQAELARLSEENEKLNKMLGAMCEGFRSLSSQMLDLTGKTPVEAVSPGSRKRKEENHDNNNIINSNFGCTNHVESSSSEDSLKKQCRFSKVSKVHVRTRPYDTTLVVKDGYQWRKYGQKVTRDNPSPRAYFKCSFAPACPVKKKVQRSAEDRSILIATYEGVHNHPHPDRAEAQSSSSQSRLHNPIAVSRGLSVPTVTLDLTKPCSSGEAEVHQSPGFKSPEFNRCLIEQMATSLAKDPGFTETLAAAISGRLLLPSPAEKW
ncbi:hypothetical protein MRB53_017896 [Persea americana]|uniref:Uncharacterized protein n=1 Tax=Persea americana TaxID=3435 RepID=A0ACC2M5Y9_PERAE|nr:hypothetical protein MRB53_017896 [Persea americana]